MSTDIELARSALGGNQKAFETLLKGAERQLHSAIISVLKHRDDDVYQAVCLKLWERLDKYAGGSAFATWAYQVARRHAIDHLRHLRTHACLSFTDDLPEVVDETDTPEQSCERTQEAWHAARKVAWVLQAVSPLEKDVLLSLRENGQPTKETVSVTRSRPEVAKALATQAKKRARELLAQKYPEG